MSRPSLEKAGKFALSYLVIPNLAFFVAGQFFYGVHPLLNLDYVVFGFLVQGIRKSVAVPLFIVLLIIDVIGMFSPVFFLDLGDAIIAGENMLRLDNGFTLRIMAIVLFAATMVGLVSVTVSGSFGRLKASETLIILSCVVLFFTGDVLNGSSKYSSFRAEEEVILSYNLVGSGVYKIISEVREVRQVHDRTGSSIVSVRDGVEGASSRLLTSIDKLSSSEIQNVVLVVVESLGVFKDREVMDRLISPLLRPKVQDRYQVSRRQVPFAGSTTTAEFRELCGVAMSYYSEIDESELKQCLPWSFQRLGFRTIAMHGFSRNMFARSEWYPLVGFEEMLFAEDMFSSGYSTTCGGAFRGICDTEVARLLRDKIGLPSEGERRFVYWLTLNSHLPVAAETVKDVEFDCEDLAVLYRYGDVCLLTKVQYQTLSAVAEVASDPSLAATHFIVVGDHSPHFFGQAKRGLYVEGKVPVVELVPRLLENGNTP